MGAAAGLAPNETTCEHSQDSQGEEGQNRPVEGRSQGSQGSRRNAMREAELARVLSETTANGLQGQHGPEPCPRPLS